MWVITVSLILVLVLFTAFVAFVIYEFGIPGSLSMISYSFNRRYRKVKVVFSPFVLVMCAFLFPAWFYISNRLSIGVNNPSWIIGLILILLIVVCLTPYYYRNRRIKILHYSAATLAFVIGAIWIFWNCFQLLYIDIALFVIFFAASLITHSFKRCKIFWLEMAVCYCVMINLLVVNLTIL